MAAHSSFQELINKLNNILDEPSFPKPNSIWRHYKGDEYQCLAVCIRESTEEVEILYKAVNNPLPIPWSRPYSEWKENIVFQGERVKRFTLIE